MVNIMLVIAVAVVVVSLAVVLLNILFIFYIFKIVSCIPLLFNRNLKYIKVLANFKIYDI